MSAPDDAAAEEDRGDDERYLIAFVNSLLRQRSVIIGLGLTGALVGGLLGLGSRRQYVSRAVFLPQAAEASAGISGIALAVSQFGIRVPTGSGAWGAPLYAELLRSRALLQPLVLDSSIVDQQEGQRRSLMDLLDVHDDRPERRQDLALRSLQRMVVSRDVRTLGAVEVTATTPWAAVSYAIVERLLKEINDFNLLSRRSQARAERQFVELQAREAEQALRDAEGKLLRFLQSNRAIGATSELSVERDRLQREVSLRQQVYTTLLQSREEARIREVRDTPVITIIEAPALPVRPESRGVLLKTVIGGVLGGVLGICLALFLGWLRRIRSADTDEAREFLAVLARILPRAIGNRLS
jgi:capsule polysaccharide export protein KpsE/RkpR